MWVMLVGMRSVDAGALNRMRMVALLDLVLTIGLSMAATTSRWFDGHGQHLAWFIVVVLLIWGSATALMLRIYRRALAEQDARGPREP